MDEVAELAARRVPGYTLPRPFYVDQGIFAADLDRVWRRTWVFAAHGCEIPRAGDFIRFDLGDDSLLIVRGDDDQVRALHNTCRHRGMQLAAVPRGNVSKIVCPYHQWSYDLDGSMRSCGGVDREAGLDRDTLRLGSARVEEVAGLIFVCLGDDPPPFDGARIEIAHRLERQGLPAARVAARRSYVVAANWKLVWENNRECWHCHVGHPEYINANYDAAADTGRTREEIALRVARLEDLGLDPDHDRPGLAIFPTANRWWSANRTPTVPGYVTESLDGGPVAPPMGLYTAHDVGTVRVRVLPGLWCHASADHAVTTRLVPVGPLATGVEVTWLVDGEAVEGRDYTLERLLPFWQRTSEQDWSLCERNQRGVLSPAYRPGPYSPSREANVAAFVDWYLDLIGKAGSGPDSR